MFAQLDYGNDDYKYTSYDSFWNCLNKVKTTIPKGSSVAFPAFIGCKPGNANWMVIKTMIEEILGNYYKVIIYGQED